MSVSNAGIPGWAVVLALSIGGALLFWPGSVGWDYNWTIAEAKSWNFAGHHRPSAAMMTSVLSLGTGNPFILTVAKFLIYFSAIGIVIRSYRDLRMTRMLLLIVLLSPVFVYYLPLLRGNAFELAFLALAFAAGLAPPSPRNMFIAAGSLSASILFASGVNPGHLCLVILYLLLHFPSWRRRKIAILSVAVIALVLLPSLIAALVSWKTDRSSTLYMSSIVGIDGLVNLGVPSCLPQSIVRTPGKSPDEVLSSNTEKARPWAVALVIGDGSSVLLTPGQATPEQRHQVINCWFSMIRSNPVLYLKERADWFARTIFSTRLEEQFVFVSADGSLQPVDEVLTDRFDLRDRPAIGALMSYGDVAAGLRLDRFTPYAVLFAFLSLIALFASPANWAFVTFSVLTIVGYLVPHALFGQAPQFRYFVVPSFVAACLSITLVELLTASPLGHRLRGVLEWPGLMCRRVWDAIGGFGDGHKKTVKSPHQK